MSCPKCASASVSHCNSGIHNCGACGHKWLPPTTQQTPAGGNIKDAVFACIVAGVNRYGAICKQIGTKPYERPCKVEQALAALKRAKFIRFDSNSGWVAAATGEQAEMSTQWENINALVAKQAEELAALRESHAALVDALQTLVSEEYRDDDDPILLAARSKAKTAIANARKVQP